MINKKLVSVLLISITASSFFAYKYYKKQTPIFKFNGETFLYNDEKALISFQRIDKEYIQKTSANLPLENKVENILLDISTKEFERHDFSKNSEHVKPFLNGYVAEFDKQNNAWNIFKNNELIHNISLPDSIKITSEHIDMFSDKTFAVVGKVLKKTKENIEFYETRIFILTKDSKIIASLSSLDFNPPTKEKFYRINHMAKIEPILDYSRLSSLAFDNDGHLLISRFEDSLILKLNKVTGEVIWRLGGNKSDFKFFGDPLGGPRLPTSVKRLKNGNIIFIDGTPNHYPSVQRAIEYKLDLHKKVASKVWMYTTPGFSYGGSGNIYRHKNGDTTIKWLMPTASFVYNYFNMEKAEKYYRPFLTRVSAKEEMIYQISTNAEPLIKHFYMIQDEN